MAARWAQERVGSVPMCGTRHGAAVDEEVWNVVMVTCAVVVVTVAAS
jgi:hypothetical protein